MHHFKNYPFINVGDSIRTWAVFLDTKKAHSGAYNSRLTSEQRIAWYDKGALPAARRVLSESHHYWHPTYADKLRSMRLGNGTFNIAPMQIPENKVTAFINAIRTELRGQEDPAARVLANFVIYWEIQNEKHASRVDITDRRYDWQEALDESIARALRDVVTYNEDTDFDVAVEYRHRDFSLAWRTDGHHLLLQALLGFSPDVVASMVTSTSEGARYQRDHAAGLRDIAGCHVNLKGKASPSGPHYLQAYHHDKFVMYQSKAKDKQVSLRPRLFVSPPDAAGYSKLADWLTTTDEAMAQLANGPTGNVLRCEVTIGQPHIQAGNWAPLLPDETLKRVAYVLDKGELA